MNLENANTASDLMGGISGVITFLLVISAWIAWKTGLLFPAVDEGQAERVELQHNDNNSDGQNVHDDSVQDQNTPHIPYIPMPMLSNESMIATTTKLYEKLNRRRSVRFISPKPVPPLQAIENIIKCAGTAPSGANLQPWTFAVLTPSDQELRWHVRNLIEKEEQMNYERRMGEKWVGDVAKLFTTSAPWEKQYLTDAPYLIIVLKHVYDLKPDGSRQTTYYNEISTSIATGMLIVALHVCF